MKNGALDPMKLMFHLFKSWFEFYHEFQFASSSHSGTCGQFGLGA
jgi:hypothetical protein